VRGTSRITPPMMMKLWMPRMVVSPTASSLSKWLWARMAMRSPVPTMRRKAATTAVAPNRPSSSPMAAKMKSVVAKGMRQGLPRPGPVPVMPPHEKA
jgi:hypothetical protein